MKEWRKGEKEGSKVDGGEPSGVKNGAPFLAEGERWGWNDKEGRKVNFSLSLALISTSPAVPPSVHQMGNFGGLWH